MSEIHEGGQPISPESGEGLLTAERAAKIVKEAVPNLERDRQGLNNLMQALDGEHKPGNPDDAKKEEGK
jgi:hypothetical protein